MSRTIIELKDIYKRFYIGTPNELEVLHGISLTVQEGEFVAIVGASGSGRSTGSANRGKLCAGRRRCQRGEGRGALQDSE